MTESEFVLPSLFSKTKWVHRYLSDAELLSILDAQVQITKRINESEKMNLREHVELLKKVAPLKVLQEATRILFDWAPPIERPHTIPIYDVNRLGLKLEGLEFIYEKINQSKVAKNDDAAADTLLWDDAVRKTPTYCKNDCDLLIVGKDCTHTSTSKFILESLRHAQKKRYTKNVRKSFAKYMKFTHAREVFETSYSNDTFDFQRDMEEGRQALDKAQPSGIGTMDPSLSFGGGNRR